MVCEFCPVLGQNSRGQSMGSRRECPQTSTPQEDGEDFWNQRLQNVVQWMRGPTERTYVGIQIVV